MITISVDPVLWRIGGFSIRWYGLMIALAVAVAVLVALQEAKRKNISEDDIYTVAFWAVLAGILFSRLFHVLDQLGYYLSYPAAIIAFQQGGLSLYGGLVGGTIAGVIYSRVRRIAVGRLADVAAPGLLLAQATGRLGCLINGDAWGGPTNLPWGVIYTHPSAMLPPTYLANRVATHPAAGYELLWDLAVFGLLWKLRPRVLPEGTLFLVYITLYSFGRFFITFLRQEEVVLAGLRQAQLIALVIMVVGAPLLAYLLRRQAA